MRVIDGVLINEQPSQLIPLGLAIKTSACCPATSNLPNNCERLLPTTSLIIKLAVLPFKFLLADIFLLIDY